MKPLSNFCFFMMPHFNMIAFSNAVEILRASNQLSQTTRYTWSLASLKGGEVEASNGLALDTLAIEEISKPDIILVCGGNDVHAVTAPEHLSVLRRLERLDVVLGGICTGAYVLAKAGLLSGYRCSIHWEHLLAHQEIFREAKFSKRLFVIDRNRVTCSGGVAPLHMMLELISEHVGSDLIAEIADYFIIENLRNADSLQSMPLVERRRSSNRVIFDIIEIMENNIEEPLSGEDLVRRVKMSSRQLQRLFRETMGVTMTRHYVRLRLRRARELLIQTDMPMRDIATACGFQAMSHFSKSYHREFGYSPNMERKK